MPKRKHHVRKQPPALWVLAGIILLLVAIFTFKNGSDNTPVSAASLESQLDQALKDGRPTFVFLHSLDCIPCKEMMGVVADVYPSFQESVVLIDVDIYKQGNENIMRREQLQSIPTLVFYDTTGKRQMFIGAMSPDKFRDTLTQLAAEQ
jgi:thiol:disulfide interchange protein